MSRTAPAKLGPIVKAEATTEKKEELEFCPVCKTSKYMRPNMILKINPNCYHKMCESCIDRIFISGPAKCPISGCSQFLRHKHFRKQTFEDLEVEREVDIRRQMAEVFDKQEEDFESVRDYNDYLNDVEDITFNKIHRIDVEETDRRFKLYEQMHEKEKRENAPPDQQEQMDYMAATKAKPAKEAQIKKRVANVKREAKPAPSTNGSAELVIKGLKAKVKKEPEAPLDPFGGLQIARQYYSLQDQYVSKDFDDRHGYIRTGGYSYQAFADKSLCEAFSGLGVFVGEESEARVKGPAAVDVKMEDPF